MNTEKRDFLKKKIESESLHFPELSEEIYTLIRRMVEMSNEKRNIEGLNLPVPRFKNRKSLSLFLEDFED